MSTVKIFAPEDWSQLQAEQHQVKIASRGPGPNDLQDVARFASPEVVGWLKTASLNPDCFYVHKLAMGGSHRYGPNRWGDGFREEVLENDCPTFVRHAKAYRQHKSKGPHYGSVKLARLRQDGVVELVTEYYGTAKIAEARGGEVADKEIESLMKRGHIPVSMGSLVPHDVCIVCQTKAPKPKDRCRSVKEGGICPLYGCLNGMLKMASDGRINYVDNPINTFYDISSVGVGADPIANGVLLPVGDFYDSVIQNAKQAEFCFDQLPETLTMTDQHRHSWALLSKVADLQFRVAGYDEAELDSGFSDLPIMTADRIRGIHSPNRQLQQDALSRIVKSAHYLDFVEFAKAAGLQQHTIDQAVGFVPNLFGRIQSAGLQDSVVRISENYKNLVANRFAKFAKHPGDGLDLRSVLRSALSQTASDQPLRCRKLASTAETIPDIAIKYAGLMLAVIDLKKPEASTLCAMLRKERYDKPSKLEGL